MHADDFRRIALALPEAVESAHMRHPDFRVRGKIFATLGYPDAEHGMLKLDLEQQERYVRLYPGVFSPAAGAWGRRGATVVRLAKVKATQLAPAVTAAWRLAAPKSLAAQPPPNAGE